MKLFKIKLDCNIFVLAKNKKEARNKMRSQDNGSEDFKKFINTVENGIIEEIKSLSQVNKKDYNYIPYGTEDSDLEYLTIKDILSLEI